MIDWNKLHDYALEKEYSCLSQWNYEWFVARYNKFVKENGHEEAIIEDVLPVLSKETIER